MEIGKEIKQKKFKSPYQKVSVNLIFTSNWLRDAVKENFKNYDLTAQQYNVLRILKGKHPGLCAAGDIKEVMLDKTPDLTRLIDRLLLKGYVSRETCPDNRRRVDIGITERGIKLVEEITHNMDSQEDMFHGLTIEEAEQLSNLLDKLRG